jgi:hypothetical protein
MAIIHSTPNYLGEFHELPDHHESHIPRFEGIAERPAIMADVVMPFELWVTDGFDGQGLTAVCLGGRVLSFA